MNPSGAHPLVSVVVPNFNYARYVGAAIQSVLDQTYEPIEIVVVDNGSTDESLKVLSRFSDRCTVIAQENQGQAGARNRGIDASSGEFVAFLDADDVWLPTKLQEQMALMSNDQRLVLVYCGLVEVNADLEPIKEIAPRFRGRGLEKFVRYPGVAVVLGGESTAVVRRSSLDRAGPFDPTLAISTGWDMWRRVAAQGFIDFVPRALVLYRQHATNRHERLRESERDRIAAAEKMFEDPDAGSMFHLKRWHLRRLDLMFARAFARSGDLGSALRSAIRAVRR